MFDSFRLKCLCFNSLKHHPINGHMFLLLYKNRSSCIYLQHFQFFQPEDFILLCSGWIPFVLNAPKFDIFTTDFTQVMSEL
jgi:hypothetical protein